MKKRKEHIEILLLLIFVCLSSSNKASGQATNIGPFERGAEIISEARKATLNGKDPSSINTLFIGLEGQAKEYDRTEYFKFSIAPTETLNQYTVEDRFFLQLPNQIRVQRIARLKGMNMGTKVIEVFNRGAHFKGLAFDGREAVESLPKQNYPSPTFEYLAWQDLFHFLLFDSFERDTKYEFLGNAKIGDKETHVVRVMSTTLDSIKGERRLFFDAETSHLIYVEDKRYETYKSELRTSESETIMKTQLKDFEEFEGAIVPKSIFTETTAVVNEYVDFGKEKSNRGELVETFKEIKEKKMKLVDFRINRKFAEGIFDSAQPIKP